MKIITRTCILVILLISIPCLSRTALKDSIITYYRSGLNTESWNGGLFLEKMLNSNTKLLFTETIKSSRLQAGSKTNQWKDQNLFLLNLSYHLNPYVSFQMVINSILFSDNQSGYIINVSESKTGYANDIKTHMLGIGTSYRTKHFSIPALIGIKEDRRFKQIDRGWHFRFGVDLPRVDLGDYINRFAGKLETDNLNRRKNSTFNMDYLVYRLFFTDASDSLKLRLDSRRRDYYISQTGEIESREETSQTAENILNYRLNKSVKCKFRVSLSARSLKINLLTGPQKGPKRERKDFNTAWSLYFLINKPSIQSNLKLSYIGQDQTYQLAKSMPSSFYSGSSLLITPDNKSSLTTLSMHIGWQWRSADSLIVFSSLQKFRYDTRSFENFDDRDELRFRLDIQNVHYFSPTFSLQLAFRINLLHLVYIYGEKSANNNWARIFKFGPKIRWNPSSKVRFSQSAEIMANYVDYDYESSFSDIRSFLYRKFRFEDSTWIQLTPRTSLFCFYRLELDENGKLLWEKWLEQKLVDRTSHTLTINLDYKPWPGFQVGPGYTIFNRKGFRYITDLSASNDRELYRDFRSYGPLIRIIYRSKRLRFRLSGSTLTTKTLNFKNQILTRINLSMSWIL
jgi:hypothetical protein